MTRLFLAAGVAALAIAAPASAKPGGGHGGGNGGGQAAASSGGGERHGGGGNAHVQTMGGFERHGGGGGNAAVRAMGGFERHGGGGGNARVQTMGGFERHGGGQRAFAFDRGRGHGGGNAAVQVQHGQGHAARMNVEHGRGNAVRMSVENRHGQRGMMPTQQFDRRQARALERQQFRPNRVENVENGIRVRGDERIVGAREFGDRNGVRFVNDSRSRGLIEGCPPGLWKKDNGCLPPGQAQKLVGAPIATAARIAALNSLPLGLQSFYPNTNDYYYRYGDGYLYQVDRTSSLINSVLPLLTGGYMPGQMFPSAYMNNYAPGYTFPTGYMNPYVADNYGWNSFYPDTPYMDYRYLNGNVYGLDPYSGMIQDVIPTYAYGYGVGQMLPAGYGYYNVPTQYRSLYYDTPDNNYWYAPGAIYQVDPSTSLITSVASLLAPGLSVGQPLPLGYDAYNVPYAYRSTYYDTPDAWYRYNNGNIYQVDPSTRLITAIVQALLT